MGTERSFSTPLMAGSAVLLAAALFVLWYVPLAACPRCTPWEKHATSSATFAVCPLCLGRKKVSWLKQLRWRMSVERSLQKAP